MSKRVFFYRDRPVFGLDISHDSLKVMQVESNSKGAEVIAYGAISFAAEAIVEGVIVKPEVIATAYKTLLKSHLSGALTTNRAVIGLSTARTFSRSMQVPLLTGDELEQAVQLEVEQYIPVPIKELYLDYTITGQTGLSQELFVVAVPRKIVDSYIALADMLDIEPVLIETTTAAATRFFSKNNTVDAATLILDIGAQSADISVYDCTTLVSGTVKAGGETFTEAIRKHFNVTAAKAAYIQVRYGLKQSRHQKELRALIEPTLQQMVTEIRRIVRYYDERYGSSRHISQVVLVGGGSNLPGLSEYLADALHLPVRLHDPWLYLDHGKLRQPPGPQHLLYGTVTGLSLLDPKAVFPA